MKSKLRGFIRRPIMAVILGLTVLGIFAGLAFGEVIQGKLTGPFGNEIDTRTEGQFLLHRTNAGTVTITATDSDANAALTVVPGGTGTLTLGDSDSAVTVAGAVTYSVTGGLTLANGESINTDTDATFDFTRNTAGTVTLTCSDDNAVCDVIYDAGGAAAITVGSADVTSITLLPDNDLTLRNGATGNVTFDFRDYADSADDDMAHVIQTVNCTDATTGAEDCDWTLGVVEAGAAAETRLNVDADGDITIGSANNGGIVGLSTGASFRNSATGNVDLDFRDYADTADDDMAHTLLRTNCTDATTGAEDCDFTIGIVEAGAAAETRLNFDADGDTTLGSATSAAFISLGTSTSLRNSATGNVVLDFRDYADSADDDMAHAEVLVNCTDATTGAEDCDYSIGVVEAGAANEVRFSIDADAGITLGSANNTALTVTTDGTGTGEVVLPLQSIAGAELVNDTVDGTELADTITIDAAFTTTGAFAYNLGNSTATTFTIATDGTGDAEVVLPSGSVGAGEIVDRTATIDLPIGSWVPCAGSVEGVWDATGVDTEPDLLGISNVIIIAYDDVGGSIDSIEICNGFTVPDDYVSGGSFQFRFTQDGATVLNIEDWSCRISVDGAAIGAVTSVALANQTAAQTISLTPAGTWAAGASIGIACNQSDAAADDTVYMHGGHAEYTATQ